MHRAGSASHEWIMSWSRVRAVNLVLWCDSDDYLLPDALEGFSEDLGIDTA